MYINYLDLMKKYIYWTHFLYTTYPQTYPDSIQRYENKSIASRALNFNLARKSETLKRPYY